MFHLQFVNNIVLQISQIVNKMSNILMYSKKILKKRVALTINGRGELSAITVGETITACQSNSAKSAETVKICACEHIIAVSALGENT